MNKLLIALLIFGAGGLVVYLLAGNTGDLPEGMQPDEDVSYEEVSEALRDEGPRRVIASCNAIAEKSSCVDYIGNMWEDVGSAEHNCEGVGTYSTDACPYAEFGGCQTGAGTVMEMVVWAYREGPGGYDEESLPYAAMACNANPQAQWILPEDQFDM